MAVTLFGRVTMIQMLKECIAVILVKRRKVTSLDFPLQKYRHMMFCVPDFLALVFRWRANGKDLLTHEDDCSLRS